MMSDVLNPVCLYYREALGRFSYHYGPRIGKSGLRVKMTRHHWTSSLLLHMGAVGDDLPAEKSVT